MTEYDKALADYNSAIALEPENAARYINRAIFYENYKKDYQQALIDFSKAIELDEENPERWYYRAFTYYQYLTDNQKALDDFAKALELDSTYVSAINARGDICRGR